MTDAVDFSILAAIPSGPDALLVSKACSNSSISSSEQRSSGGDALASGQYLRYQVGVQID